MPQTQIDNIKIAYDDSGSGPAIILIHGFPFNRTLWQEQFEALRATHRVIVPDLRGFGESEATDEASINRMAEDVALLMDTLKISSAIVGGLSMGGYVVLAFYKKFRSRVRALVLADTRPQADTDEGKQLRAQQVKEVLAEGMSGITNSMLPKLLTPETVSTRPDVVKRIRDMMLKTNPKGAAAALKGMATREDQTGMLNQIDVPTLILVGKGDPITPMKDSEMMHQEIVGSKLVVIDNAAHVPNIEQVALFNSELARFISALD